MLEIFLDWKTYFRFATTIDPVGIDASKMHL